MRARLLQAGAAAAGTVALLATVMAGRSGSAWNLAWTAAGACAVLGVLAGRRHTAPSQRGAWRILTAAVAAWLGGQLVWDLYAVTDTGGLPTPGDALWLATAPLMAIALRRLIPVRGTGAQLAWLETVALVVAAASLVAAKLYGFVESSSASSALEATAILYPALFTAVAVIGLQALVANEITPWRRPGIWMIVSGAIIEAIAFSLWSPQLLDGTYVPGASAADPLWALGMVLIGAGGVLHRPEELVRPDRQERRLAGWLPAGMFLLLLAAIAEAAATEHPLPTRQILHAGLLVVGTVLITRAALLEKTQRALLRSERAAHDELRRTREARARYFEMSTDLLCTITTDARFIEANAAWLDVLGWRPEQLAGRPVIEFIHPDHVERTAARLSQISERGTNDDFENLLRSADGSHRWIRWRSARSSEDHIVYARGTDVTAAKERELEREAARHALQVAHDDLERRVEERTRALSAANAELEAFAYSVSHDLRAPLRAVAGFAQALMEDYGARLDETGRDYAERVVAGASRMSALIDQLLGLSRITRRQMIREPVDLAELAQRVTAELVVAEPDRDVKVEMAGDMRTTGDRVLLETLLRNLVGNAWKFTEQVDGARIDIGSTGTNGDRVFYVRDNGAGFDPEYADKLFRPFERLHRADEFAGTGIGLATVRRIVSRHGGEVWAEGKPGEGATFYFKLP